MTMTPEKLAELRVRLNNLTESPYDGGVACGIALGLIDELETMLIERDHLLACIRDVRSYAATALAVSKDFVFPVKP